jgi:hypothetical protein
MVPTAALFDSSLVVTDVISQHETHDLLSSNQYEEAIQQLTSSHESTFTEHEMPQQRNPGHTLNLPCTSSNFSIDDLRQIMLQDVSIPPREPLKFSTHLPDLPPDFNTLCAKGPKFIPTPNM